MRGIISISIQLFIYLILLYNLQESNVFWTGVLGLRTKLWAQFHVPLCFLTVFDELQFLQLHSVFLISVLLSMYVLESSSFQLKLSQEFSKESNHILWVSNNLSSQFEQSLTTNLIEWRNIYQKLNFFFFKNRISWARFLQFKFRRGFLHHHITLSILLLLLVPQEEESVVFEGSSSNSLQELKTVEWRVSSRVEDCS